MTKSALTLFCCSIFLTATCLAANRPTVIYGVDNRKDVYESTNETHRLLAKSTAAMIPNNKVKPISGSDLVQIIGKTLKTSMNVCSSEVFSSQITSADCSGFLISDTHLVTAGHCITNTSDCMGNKWVFDYAHETEPVIGTTDFFVDQTKVYSCRKIIERSQGNGIRDFAVIELDRPVLDRNPLKIRTSGIIQKGTTLVVIGHPSGLPTKIADGGTVESVSEIEFVADVDTYGGNSGSAVFNDITGEVEGILVRGSEDYVVNRLKGCNVSSKCKVIDGTLKCRGESITKITGIKSMDPNNRPSTNADIKAFLAKEPNILVDFVSNKYGICFVKNSHQLYNQLYIKNEFKGNFRKNLDDEALKANIAGHVLDGTCVKKEISTTVPTPTPVPTPVVTPAPSPVRPPVVIPAPTPVRPPVVIPTPTPAPAPTPVVTPAPAPEVKPIDIEGDRLLIQSFVDKKYSSCFVKPNVRIYNQFYVNGTFKGNFVMEVDNHLLAESLRNYIADKSCILKE